MAAINQLVWITLEHPMIKFAEFLLNPKHVVGISVSGASVALTMSTQIYASGANVLYQSAESPDDAWSIAEQIGEEVDRANR
jgi:hypothetical protein